MPRPPKLTKLYAQSISTSAPVATCPESDGAVVTIGNFDGVHAGHRYLIDRLRDVAERRNLAVGVVTFFPDPIRILHPDLPMPYLTTLEDRVSMLLSHVDFVAAVEFDSGLASMTAREFLLFLQSELHVVSLVMGHDNRIGKDRLGGDEVVQVARDLGIETEILATGLTRKQDRISSSSIRRDVACGDLSSATEKLGRTYAIPAVASTFGEAANIEGASTIKVHAWRELALPPDGLYEGWIRLAGPAHPAILQVQASRITRVVGYGLDGDVDVQPVHLGLVRKCSLDT